LHTGSLTVVSVHTGHLVHGSSIVH
jgi:hypothetical protein